MSELKTYNSERIYWAVEQVEQEADDISGLHLDDNLFYLKSEADEVIAEKDKKIIELQSKLTLASLAEDCANLRNKRCNYCSALLQEMSRVRRLKRALYKACVNWAMAESYSVLNDAPTANRWIRTLQKLKTKLEGIEYDNVQ